MKVYIAKDKNGVIFVYNYKPVNIRGIWTCKNGICKRGFYGFPIEEKDLPEGVNPQWTDKKPIEVELKVEKI